MQRNHTGPKLRNYPYAESNEAIILALSIFRARKQAKQAARQQRLANHRAPRLWVHAHIESRADYKSGYLAELVADNHPITRNHWQNYLAESRTAYRASR